MIMRLDTTMTHCKNVFMNLDGTISPHLFPVSGMWRFDGQFFYLPKEMNG